MRFKISLYRAFGASLGIALAFASTGCTKKAEKSAKIQVQLPAEVSRSNYVTPAGHALNLTKSSSWGYTSPTQISDIKCYAVAVDTPEITTPAKCTDSAGGIVAKANVIAGPFPAGASFSIDVPSGAGRKFYLIGFAAATLADCAPASTGGPDRNKLSSPKILHSTPIIKDLVAGDNTLEIKTNFTSSVAFDTCTQWSNNGTPNTNTGTVQFTTATQSISEAAGTVTVQIGTATAATSNITVPYTVSGTATAGTDHNLSNGTLTIASGATQGQTTFTITQDTDVDPAETIILTLGTATNATASGIVSQTITINDDDTAGPTVQFTTASGSGYESVGTVSMTVQMSATQASVVTVPYTVSGTATGSGTDYTLAAGNLTFTIGSTSMPLYLGIVDDTTVESAETVIVTLGSPSTGTLGTNAAYAYTINDDDISAFSVSGITGGSDATVDNVLGVPSNPTVTWGSTPEAAQYNVTIYESDGATVRCAQNTTASVTYTFTNCSPALVAGQNYRAGVQAVHASGTTRNATGSAFLFSVNQAPTYTGSATYYVMQSSSFTLAASSVTNDPNADTVTVSSITNVDTGAGASATGTTTFTYTSGATQVGADPIQVTFADSYGATVVQNITVHVMTAFTWIGATDNNWSTASNWCGSIAAGNTSCQGAGSAPATSDVTYFNESCSTNCTPTLAAATTVGAIKMRAGFTGTVNQGTYALTINTGTGGILIDGGTFQGGPAAITINGTAGFVMTGGTFVGGAGNFSLTGGNAPFNISGGTFTATSGILTFNQAGNSTLTIAAGATFIHNSGSILLGSGSTYALNFNSHDLNNFDVGSTFIGAKTINLGSNFDVLGDLSLGSSAGATHDLTISGAQTISVHGNVNGFTSSFTTGASPCSISGVCAMRNSTALVSLVSSTNQTVTGYVPGLQINKAGGIATLSGNIGIAGGGFEHIAGTVDATSATLRIIGAGTVPVASSSAINFYSVEILDISPKTINISGELLTSGDLTLDAAGAGSKLNSGTLTVQGNLTLGAFGGGAGTLSLTGTTQSMSAACGTGLACALPHLRVASSGTVSLTSPMTLANGLTGISGTFSSGANTLYVMGSNVIIDPGSVTFGDMRIELTGTNSLVGALQTGNLDISGSGSILGGTIKVAKSLNVLDTPADANTFQLEFNQGYAATVYSCSGCGTGGYKITTGTITVNKPGYTLTMGTILNATAAGQDFNVAAGTMTMNGNNLTVADILTISSGAVLTQASGTLNYGSLTNNGTLN